ncbi:MAG: pre-peptidase C-terminal domain-containing protein [Solirubrobacteraceae bacterium]
MYSECLNYAGKPSPVIPFGGTSESAPLTAGVAALVIQAYAKTHGTDPTPQQVKQIIGSTADDIGSPADQQGAGLIDAYKAVLAAESYRAPASTPKPAGATLLKSDTQLSAIDQPGTPQTLTDTVTNSGASTQKVSLSSRALGPYQSVKTDTVTLSDSSSPKTTDWAGAFSNCQPITFQVPAGDNRLNASIAFQNASTTDLNARVRLTLVDPNGNLAAYSVPQGNGNYGNVQVTNPTAGTWTAYVWSKVSSLGGTTGPVLFGAGVAKYTTFGQVSPQTLTLAPGQSAPVTLSVTTPSTPGDSSGAIVLNSDTGASFARQTTVPVILRSLIPTGKQSFNRTLTGGNGRQFNLGETFTYEMDVPAGKPELNAAITLADNPNNPFSAFLISPNGEALAFAANELSSHNGSFTDELGAQLHVLSPAQGAWKLVVEFAPQVSGTALAEPFTMSTDQAAVPASATGLPQASSVKLAAGAPTTYGVQVTNNGPAPEAYFIDARLPTSTQLALTSLTSPATNGR